MAGGTVLSANAIKAPGMTKGGALQFLEDDLDMIYMDQPDHDIPWP